MSSKLTIQNTADEEFEGELQPGTKLFHGQYVIEEFLNNGGFGITYLAKDSLHRLVVIKECFPEALCDRRNSTVRVRSRSQVDTFRTIVELFTAEARKLARLSHPNIVGVHQVFEDNGTAYMAMDFVEGRDLMEIADGAASFNPATLEQIVIKLLDAIEFIHSEGILHCDIAPDNILLSKQNDPVMIDFGAARETVAKSTRLLGSMRTVKDGYSPQEFYFADGEQTPSSDLYSLAASLYHVIAKELPINAQTRLSAIAGGENDPYVSIKDRATGYSEPFLDAIDKALNLFPKNRIQSAAEWRMLITHSSTRPVTRGTKSTPALAIDDGNIVRQFEDNAQGALPVGKRSKGHPNADKVRSTRSTGTRPTSHGTDEDVRAALRADAGAKKRVVFGAAAASLVAVIGATAYIMTGSGETMPVPNPEPVAREQVAITAPANGVPSAPPETGKDDEFSTFLEKMYSDEGTGTPVAENTALPEEVTSPEPPDAQLAAVEDAPANETTTSSGTEQPADTGIQNTSSVITGKIVLFPVVADATDPSIIASAGGPVAMHLEPGYRVVSINGYPVGSLDEFQRVVDATSDYSIGDTVEVAIGIEVPTTGNTFVRRVKFPTGQQTMLLNGVSFQTSEDGDTWTTVVTSGNGPEPSDFQPGDQIVAYVPTNELIDKQDSIGNVLRREIEGGSTQFSFAVKRDGELWVVTMPYAAQPGD